MVFWEKICILFMLFNYLPHVCADSIGKPYDPRFIIQRRDSDALDCKHNTANYAKKTIVNSESELLTVLASSGSGDFIYLSSSKVYNLSNIRKIKIPGGVTLLSKGEKNALVYSNNKSSNPLFVTDGDNITISGIRFMGPDSNYLNEITEEKISALKSKASMSINRLRAYDLPNSVFINIQHQNVTIRNCEIFNWSYAGILINNGGRAVIENCKINNNRRFGLGYGIYLDVGYAEIKANTFDKNRHAIAASGRKGTSYYAHNNICYGNSTELGHAFDMHGGVDRKDGTNIAGDFVRIENNTFYYTRTPVIKIRGVSVKQSIISNNEFISVSKNKSHSSTHAIQQSGGKRGNLTLKNNNIR